MIFYCCLINPCEVEVQETHASSRDSNKSIYSTGVCLTLQKQSSGSPTDTTITSGIEHPSDLCSSITSVDGDGIKTFSGKRGEGNPSIFTDVAFTSALGNRSKSLSLGTYLIGQQHSRGLLPITVISPTCLPRPRSPNMLNISLGKTKIQEK